MSTKPIASCDVECYRNYFLIKLKPYDESGFIEFEQFPDQPLNVMGAIMALSRYELHGFNFKGYDILMITLALNGASCDQLKEASDRIILGRMAPWQFYQYYQLQEFNFDWVDLMEVAPGVRISLKMYAGRMHSGKMQDLPIDPTALLTREQMQAINVYCGNDLEVTHDMSIGLEKRLAIRRSLSARFGLDLRSKSDAQIAEAVVKKLAGVRPGKQKNVNYSFHYSIPSWVEFQTDYMRGVLDLIARTPFYVDHTGVQLPKEIEGTDIAIGSSLYRMGIGGLHSKEANRTLISTPDAQLSDHDVRSYYPSLILNAGCYPPAVGPMFLDIYRGFYDERMATTDKTVKDTNKIILNGAFGKLGSIYSILFAPELLIQTTISGQLAILMLIEAMELAGVPVVSANTDGIVCFTPRHMFSVRDAVIACWEKMTGLETEASEYLAIFNKSVNDYLAIGSDRKLKRKGVTFATAGLNENKHPDREICADAAVAYLAHGTPIRETVMACRDVRKFVRIRRATHGAVDSQTGEVLGKAIRWYYGRDKSRRLLCAKSVRPGQFGLAGSKIASSDGAVPCMQLPDEFPDDLDYDYYIEAAREIINETGVWAGRA